MIRYQGLPPRYQTSQEQIVPEFMSEPVVPSLTDDTMALQAYEYNFPIRYNFPTADNQRSSSLSASHPYLSWLDDIDHQIEELRQESEEACTLDAEIDPIPDSAYDDAYWLLEMLFDGNVPTPDIGWLADGGIEFEWRSRNIKGIATMSIYGDNQVIYVASLGGTHRVKGTCVLSDHPSLAHFFTILIILCSQ